MTNQEKFKKKKIVLHFTAGRGDPGEWWLQSSGKYKTAYFVSLDGISRNYFDDSNWSCHIYSHKKDEDKRFYQMEKESIGIEIESWGPLDFRNEKLYTYTGKNFCLSSQTEHFINEDFRGKKYYERIYEKQITTVKRLIKEICHKHNIKENYFGNSEYSDKIYEFEGVCVHSNFRADKYDIPNFIWGLIGN